MGVEPFGMSPFGRRVARPGAGRVPVIVVTGFLGAGKTTLLRAMLAHPAARDTAVIVNEFGEVGIDDVLLRTSTEDVRLIGNGCLCCSARNDLQRVLRNLAAEREAGTIPRFRRVFVETSGLSEPLPILQSFATDRSVATHYAFGGLVTVVDAVLGPTVEGSPGEWTEQVVLADRLVISKGDLAAPRSLDALRARLTSLNPSAPILDGAAVKADPSQVLTPPELRRLPRSFAAGADGSDYGTFCLEFDQPFRWAVFTRAMDVLVDLRGSDLLRVKGLLNVEGSRGPVVAHYVQHLSSPPEELTTWPDEDRRTRLVFITRNLGRRHVADLFQAVLALVSDDERQASISTTSPGDNRPLIHGAA